MCTPLAWVIGRGPGLGLPNQSSPNAWFVSRLAEHTSGLESLKIWLDVGSDDWWLTDIETLHASLVSQGLHVEWHVLPGGHDAEYWIDHLPEYLRFYGSALAGADSSS